MQSVISFSSFFSLCCRTLMNIKSLYSYLILFITANILIVILISQIVKSFFLINQFLKMEGNYFTILWWFLPYINMNQPQVYMCPPHLEPPSQLPPHPILLGSSRALALGALLHASNLHWSSISNMVTNMFQCYSLKSSLSRLLPLTPKVCSLHLCLFCWPACRIIVTIFLNSIYMCKYTVFIFLFLTYFTLYNRLQFNLPH